MKKIWILTLIIAMQAEAKLNDFNNLIEENSKAQNELHADLKNNLKDTQATVNPAKTQRFVVDTTGTINVPTSKSFLSYKKAKINYKPTYNGAEKRLAQELILAD